MPMSAQYVVTEPPTILQSVNFYHCMQVFTEMLRLNNENALREHTDEEGDLFLWFKHQASLGVVGAQVCSQTLT